jgi:Double-GTPase 2
MEKKKIYCQYQDCQADWNEASHVCLNGEIDAKKCKNYIGNDKPKERSVVEGEPKPTEDEKKTSKKQVELSIPWTGDALGGLDLTFISNIKQPFFMGIIGKSKAGKTTLLATLYMLLRSGKSIGDYQFAGSYTLLGWEKIAQGLTFRAKKTTTFPPHTPANTSRIPSLLHLLLKDKQNQYHDIIFTDAPGEWFSNWAKSANADDSKGAKWIDEVADAYIYVADCKALNNDFGTEQSTMKPIISRMSDTHDNRPIAWVWMKADYSLAPEVKEKLLKDIKKKLHNVKDYNVSVINRNNEEVIESILILMNQLLMENHHKKNLIPIIKPKNEEDFFFIIR